MNTYGGLYFLNTSNTANINAANTSIIFKMGPSYASTLTLTTGQNVGIGTTSPAYKLDVD
jgi:hypothetical protein